MGRGFNYFDISRFFPKDDQGRQDGGRNLERLSSLSNNQLVLERHRNLVVDLPSPKEVAESYAWVDKYLEMTGGDIALHETLTPEGEFYAVIDFCHPGEGREPVTLMLLAYHHRGKVKEYRHTVFPLFDGGVYYPKIEEKIKALIGEEVLPC